jgi:hypothetical protein
MPGFDRTGPRGEGPLTGGGRGRCGGYRGNYGYFGRGRGGRPWGGGRGFGWGGGWFQGGPRGWAGPGYAPVSEDLRAEADFLRDRLAQVEDELARAESAQVPEEDEGR